MYFIMLRKERYLLDPGQQRFTFEEGSAEKGLEKALKERKELEKTHPEIER